MLHTDMLMPHIPYALATLTPYMHLNLRWANVEQHIMPRFVPYNKPGHHASSAKRLYRKGE